MSLIMCVGQWDKHSGDVSRQVLSAGEGVHISVESVEGSNVVLGSP